MMVAKALNADTFFTRLYNSDDKGTVDNRIGQLRRFSLKKTDLSMVSSDQVKRGKQLLNNMPLKKIKL
jgi:IS30 family transposase